MFDSLAAETPILTARQQAVLDVVQQHLAERGYPPTVREIGDVLGLASSSTVHSHLAALERAGIIERDPTKPRALAWGPSAAAAGVDVSGADASAAANRDTGVSLPLVGDVAAGAPVLADEHIEQYVPVPRQLTRSGESFLLRVRGDSMEGVGILDGDWVVVRQQPDAPNGAIVVALVGDEAEATCKRLQRRDGRIELHSENPAYDPIVNDRVQLAGLVTGVMRSL